MNSWIFDSLKRRSRNWIREWQRSSIVGGWSSLSSINLLHVLTERPFLHVSLLAAISVISSLTSMWVWQAGYVPANILRYESADFLAFFGTLWTLQATLAALVYPLVISFVAVMLQRRASAKLSLQLYLVDAAVVPSGGSSLALVAWMGLQYFALPYVAKAYVAAAMFGNSLWFLHNILLTVWFLVRTVRYLDDGTRYESFKRYAVLVAFPREVQNYLLGIFLSNLRKEEPADTNTGNELMPQVVMYPMSDGRPVVTITAKRDSTVIDVRMRLLAWGINLWVSKNKKAIGLRSDAHTWPTLIVSAVPNGRPSKEIVVARVRDGTAPGWLSSKLIKLSMVVSSSYSMQKTVTTSEILEELAVEVLTLVEEKRFQGARETMAALVDVHAALLNAGSFTGREGSVDNAALLWEPYGFGSMPIHSNWISAYRGITEAAVQTITLELAVFERLCYVPVRLLGRARTAHIQLLTELLDIPNYASYRLGQWWSAQADERGLEIRNSQTSVRLPNPVGALYARALQILVEGWEFTKIYTTDFGRNDASLKWIDYQRIGTFEGARLRKMVVMFLSAVQRGDDTAAAWLGEWFTLWPSNNGYPTHALRRPEGQFAAIHFSWFEQDWGKLSEVIVAENAGDPLSVAEQVFVTALNEYWLDLRLLLVLVLLSWTGAAETSVSFSYKLARKLYEGENPRTDEVCAQRFSDWEAILLRFFTIEVDETIRQIADLNRPNMVAGRVYSRRGADDITSYRLQQAQIITALMSGPTRRARRFEAYIQRIGHDVAKLERHSREVREIRDAVDSIENNVTGQLDDVIRQLRQASGINSAYEEALSWARETLEQVAIMFDTARAQIVENAILSPLAIDSIRDEVSSFILGPDNQEFPFTVAEIASCDDGVYPEHELTFTGIRKEPLTSPPLEEFDDSGRTSYNEHISGWIAGGIVLDYIRSKRVESLSCTSETDFSVELAEQAQNIRQRGQTPIVLLCSQMPDWTMPYWDRADGDSPVVICAPPKPEDIKSVHSYVNGIPAHRIAVAGQHCFVVALDDFQRIVYQPHAGISCIALSTAISAEQKVTLTFSWRFGALKSV